MPLKHSKTKAAFQANLRELDKDFKATGKLGTSKPKSKEAARKQALAIAYSIQERAAKAKRK